MYCGFAFVCLFYCGLRSSLFLNCGTTMWQHLRIAPLLAFQRLIYFFKEI